MSQDKNCDRGDIFVNERGLYDPPEINPNPYYKLLCIIESKNLKLAEIYYPFVYFISREQLDEIIKIGKRAEVSGIRYLQPVQKEMPDGEQIMIVYRPAYEENAYLFTFFIDHEKDLFKEEPASRFQQNMTKQYIVRHLQGYNDKTIEGIIKFNYYRGGMSPKLQEEYEQLYPSPFADNFEEAQRKYDFILQKDKFRDFKEKYKQIRQRALKIIEATKQSEAFKKYQKTKKSHKYVFPRKLFAKYLNIKSV